MNIFFPFTIDHRGLTAGTTSNDEHIRQLIEQLLFTAPGERVNRPDFGCGLPALVFETGSEEVIAAHQALIRGTLQQQLGSLIRIEKVTVAINDGVLDAAISYVDLASQKRSVAQFEREN